MKEFGSFKKVLKIDLNINENFKLGNSDKEGIFNNLIIFKAWKSKEEVSKEVESKTLI